MTTKACNLEVVDLQGRKRYIWVRPDASGNLYLQLHEGKHYFLRVNGEEMALEEFDDEE